MIWSTTLPCVPDGGIGASVPVAPVNGCIKIDIDAWIRRTSIY